MEKAVLTTQLWDVLVFWVGWRRLAPVGCVCETPALELVQTVSLRSRVLEKISPKYLSRIFKFLFIFAFDFVQPSFVAHLLRTFRLEQWNCSRAAKWHPSKQHKHVTHGKETSHSLKVHGESHAFPYRRLDWHRKTEFEATRPIRSTSPKSLGVQNGDGCWRWHRGLLVQKLCKRCDGASNLAWFFIFFFWYLLRTLKDS